MENTINIDNPLQNQVLSLRDENVRSMIRTRYIKGYEIKEILKELKIPEGTYESALWRNTQGLRDFMIEIKKERFLNLAEDVSSEILTMETTKNAKMLAIKQKEAEFIRETLLKDHGYSKRIETIGLNINKTEPLDDEQKEKLNKLLKKTGNTIQDNTDVVNKSENIDNNF